MSEYVDEGPEIIFGVAKGAHYTKDGNFLDFQPIASTMSEDDARSALEAMGATPADSTSRGRRLAVAFSSARWRSTWDPRKSDPNLN
jgi:hypothetical protein